MEDLLKVLVYLLAVVIYVLIKMKKKPVVKEQPKDQRKEKLPRHQSLPHTVPAKSFADDPPKKSKSDLRETIKTIEKEIKHSQKTVKSEKHLKAGKVYEERENKRNINTSLESSYGSSEVSGKNFQDHFDKIQKFNEIKNYESEYGSQTIVFEYPQEDKNEQNPYLEFLRDPENVKKAFVMKEIFDRKHF